MVSTGVTAAALYNDEARDKAKQRRVVMAGVNERAAETRPRMSESNWKEAS